MGTRAHHFSFLLLVALSIIACSAQNCEYTLLIKTGNDTSAGTNSKISLTLSNEKLETIEIPNIETWGKMKKGHNYFEQNNLDVFRGTAPCLKSPVCAMFLNSDGRKESPSWYCEYVEVFTTNSAHAIDTCSHILFSVNQWLSNTDKPPYQLFAFRDLCNIKSASRAVAM